LLFAAARARANAVPVDGNNGTISPALLVVFNFALLLFAAARARANAVPVDENNGTISLALLVVFNFALLLFAAARARANAVPVDENNGTISLAVLVVFNFALLLFAAARARAGFFNAVVFVALVECSATAATTGVFGSCCSNRTCRTLLGNLENEIGPTLLNVFDTSFVVN
jgi:hypothetical protein